MRTYIIRRLLLMIPTLLLLTILVFLLVRFIPGMSSTRSRHNWNPSVPAPR